MNDLSGMDLVPEPKIITAALKACRRVNDYALAVRYIEAVKEKCGPKVNEIYPYVLKVSINNLCITHKYRLLISDHFSRRFALL
jgi:Cytochrome c oxidase subunit Va